MNSQNSKKSVLAKDTRGIRIQIGLTLFLIIIVLIVASVIHFPWQYISKTHIRDLAEELNNEILNGVSSEISKLFEEASVTQLYIRDSFKSGLIDIDDREEALSFYLQLSKSHPAITWFSFGFPDGDFFGAQRLGEDAINVVDSRYSEEKGSAERTTIYYRRNSGDFELETRHTEPEDDYYSPQRSWYKAAIQTIDEIWTKVYVFSTSKKPGLNTARSLDIDGEFVGVISIALELEDISLYMKELSIGKTGKVFLLDPQNQLVASQDPEEMIMIDAENEVPRLGTIDEIDNDFLRIVSEAIDDQDIQLGMLDGPVNISFTPSFDSEEYFLSFMPESTNNWTLVTVIPSSDYLAEIEQQTVTFLYIVLISLLVLLVFIILFSRKIIVRPVMLLAEQMSLIETFDLDSVGEFSIKSGIREINLLANAIKRMNQGLLSFKKYIPTEVVRDMISQGIEAEIGGEEREITIFFSDLVSFTKIFEKMGNKLVPQLGEYLSAMSELILANKGTIDKYIGDAIMAFWGAPSPNKNHALYACKTALTCQKKLNILKARWEKENQPIFETRIGINTGPVVVGNVGSRSRLNYTVLGDPVNVASRLEALNKVYKTSILMGQNTYEKVREHIITRRVDTVVAYGKVVQENIYEPVAMRDELGVTEKLDWINVYDTAMDHYRARHWNDAIKSFKKVIEMRGGSDYPSLLFAHKCVKFKKNPPPADWEGFTVMTSK